MEMITHANPQSRDTATSRLIPGRGFLLQRKCACGSPTSSLTGECTECTSKQLLQTKLTIGASNDPLEQEADRMADQVLAAPANSAVSGARPHIQRFMEQPGAQAGAAPLSVKGVLTSPGRPLSPALQHDMEQRFGHDFSRVRVHSRVADQVMNLLGRDGAATQLASVASATGKPNVQRRHLTGEDKTYAPLHIMTKGLAGQSCDSAPSGEEEEEEEEEEKVMRKATPGPPHQANGDVGSLLSRTRGGGRPLPDTIRTFMEARFGHDFGDVRIHTDSNAAQMTKDLHAEAFTTGRDIYFRPGAFAPQVFSGRRLLAHELTHVVQQRGNDSVGRSTGRTGVGPKYWIQRYGLKGFPPTEEAAMKAAIPVAADTVRRCSKLSDLDRVFLSILIKETRYDFVPDLGLCGWTFPSSWYVEIGKNAFDKNVCCDLPSTIAHEVSHTYWFTEGGARKLECKCFGCSC